MPIEEKKVMRLLRKAFDLEELLSEDYEKLGTMCPEHFVVSELFKGLEVDRLEYDSHVTPKGETVIRGELEVVIWVTFWPDIDDDEYEQDKDGDIELHETATINLEFKIVVDEADTIMWKDIDFVV